MISIVGPRGSGKTVKLFEAARKNNTMILTMNSHALREKARALVDESPYFLAALLDKYYGIKMIGFNATEEGNENKEGN